MTLHNSCGQKGSSAGLALRNFHSLKELALAKDGEQASALGQHLPVCVEKGGGHERWSSHVAETRPKVFRAQSAPQSAVKYSLGKIFLCG